MPVRTSSRRTPGKCGGHRRRRSRPLSAAPEHPPGGAASREDVGPSGGQRPSYQQRHHVWVLQGQPTEVVGHGAQLGRPVRICGVHVSLSSTISPTPSSSAALFGMCRYNTVGSRPTSSLRRRIDKPSTPSRSTIRSAARRITGRLIWPSCWPGAAVVGSVASAPASDTGGRFVFSGFTLPRTTSFNGVCQQHSHLDIWKEPACTGDHNQMRAEFHACHRWIECLALRRRHRVRRSAEQCRGGPPAVRMRRGGALHEQCERDAQLVQLLISGTTCRPKLLASDAFSTTPPPAR